MVWVPIILVNQRLARQHGSFEIACRIFCKWHPNGRVAKLMVFLCARPKGE